MENTNYRPPEGAMTKFIGGQITLPAQTPDSADARQVAEHGAENRDDAGQRGDADRNGGGANPQERPAQAVALSHDLRQPRMARGAHCPPEGAIVVKTYKEAKELLRAFAGGLIQLLVIVARPGLAKSRLARQAVDGIENRRPLIIRLRKSALDFYTDLYAAKDQPVILDDDDDLMSDRLCREYIKALTETDTYKRLDWGTKTKILQDEGVPKRFWTTSTVCLITNHWNSCDPIFQALESRAEFIYFDPDWVEVYREVGTWFWDQEIYDYVWEHIQQLKEPDMRLFVKAYNRKQAGLITMGWRRLVDEYVDDSLGLVVRRLLEDTSYASNDARAEAFCAETERHRATFYRRLAQIKRYRPQAKPSRIILKHTDRPVERRPRDAVNPGRDGTATTGPAARAARSKTAGGTTNSQNNTKRGNGQPAKCKSGKGTTRKSREPAGHKRTDAVNRKPAGPETHTPGNEINTVDNAADRKSSGLTDAEASDMADAMASAMGGERLITNEAGDHEIGDTLTNA